MRLVPVVDSVNRCRLLGFYKVGGVKFSGDSLRVATQATAQAFTRMADEDAYPAQGKVAFVTLKRVRLSRVEESPPEGDEWGRTFVVKRWERCVLATDAPLPTLEKVSGFIHASKVDSYVAEDALELLSRTEDF